MTVKELKELLENAPDDAKVFIESDHGQCPESAGGILSCYDKKIKESYYGEDFSFEDVDPKKTKFKLAQAILIR